MTSTPGLSDSILDDDSIIVPQDSCIDRSQLIMKNIDVRLWLKLMSDVEVSEYDLQSVIMNYLFINKYENSYKEFINEVNFGNDDLKPTISDRKFINESILEGRVKDAINQINSINEEILKQNNDLLFLLLLYHLVDIIKKGNLVEAVTFAKDEIANCVEKNPKLLKQLEEAMSLIAFQDLSTPEALRIIESTQKPHEISKTVDESIIGYYNLDPKPILENIIKEVVWVESQLQSKSNTYMLQLENIERCGFIRR